MSRKKNKSGRSKGSLASFVGLELFLLECQAYDSLNLCARAAYVEVGRLYNGANNGKLALSARGLAQRLHVSKATAFRALRDLEERGFIECVKVAGFNLKTGSKRAAEWRMTRWKCDVTGQLPSKAFMNWKPGKNHFAVSSQAHPGFISSPLAAEKVPNDRSVGTRRNRNGVSGVQSGFTTGPHLDICHVATHSKPAQPGAANQKASAPASANTLTEPLEAWTDVHGAALKSLNELADRLTPDLQSWTNPDLVLSQPAKSARLAA